MCVRGGDAALRRWAQELDGLGPDQPLVRARPALDTALAELPQSQKDLLARVAGRIRRFALAQRASLHDLELPVPGGWAGHRVNPLATAGCYAPGGRYPLPSSVLMTAVTARAAGVGTVVVASPRPSPLVLAAAAVAQADLVVAAGGAQAIAALAHGTPSVPACESVVGPGNIWVTAAKLEVQDMVHTDGAAGPSELVVVADRGSDHALVAADLLAQAEHDTLAQPVLIALDQTTIGRVRRALARQLADLPTAATAREALRLGCATLVADPVAAVAICNRLAPEHLQWSTDRPVPPGLLHFGGLFSGRLAAEVLGDYGAGPNHVLPTGGAARRRGGLWVGDFLTVRTTLHLDRPEEIQGLAEDAAALARLEGLEGHARAAEQRMVKK